MRVRAASHAIVLSVAISALGVSTGFSADLRESARVAAEWAIANAKPQTLADSISIYLESGASTEPDDPFSVAEYLKALREMPGGAELAEAVLNTRARGQIGGSSRIDVSLGTGETHLQEMTLVSDEAAWIEARLWRGGDTADVDIALKDTDGNLLGEDAAPSTGIDGFGALIEYWPDSCQDVILHTTNKGPGSARIAIMVPLSAKGTCGETK